MKHSEQQFAQPVVAVKVRTKDAAFIFVLAPFGKGKLRSRFLRASVEAEMKKESR